MKIAKYKSLTTQVSIYREPREASESYPYCYGGNPVFNCIKISLEDEGAGGFLKITDDTDGSEGKSISLDWDEWDAVVKAVAKVRPDWNY